MSRKPSKKEKIVKELNGIVLYVIFSVLFFLVWSGIIFSYPFPVMSYFHSISYYERITMSVFQDTACAQQPIVNILNDYFVSLVNEPNSQSLQNFNALYSLSSNISSNNFYYVESEINSNDREEISKILAQEKEYVESIYSKVLEFNETKNESIIQEATELAFVTLSNLTVKLNEIATERIKKLYNSYDAIRITNRAGVAIVDFIYLLFILYRIYLYHIEFEMYKNMLLVIPNSSKQAITMAVDLFNSSNKKKENSLSEVSLSRHIIKQSLNGILMVSSTGIVQDVNNSAIQILQRKKEDIIQQHVITILMDVNENQSLLQTYNQLFEQNEDSGVIENQITQNANAKNVTEIDNSLTVRTGAGTLKLISCKIIKISNVRMWGDEMSYAFILRDITEFSKNETELKGAQNRVENLLSKIMPKVIATRLMSKSDREDIISCVDRAVIIFIGIHNFVS